MQIPTDVTPQQGSTGKKQGNMTLPKDHDFLTCEHKDIQMAGHIIEISAYEMISELKESVNK